jgi:ATP-dependent Clp protease ATP-binding subunit ClpX
VLDETDRLFEPQYGSNDINYSDLPQNQLLKLCNHNHDKLFFGDEKGGSGFSIGCAKVSIVFLGSFQRLLEHKNKQLVGRPCGINMTITAQ